MSFLPLTKNQKKSRQALAEDIWNLIQVAAPVMYKDMQRVSLMKPFDASYVKEEFPKLSKDFAVISVFGLLLDRPDEFDWRLLKRRWLKIRNIVAKYLDNTNDERIAIIDNQCNFMSFRRLPPPTFSERPRKALPRQWWDEHPSRDKSLENIAVNWWRMAKVPSCKYEDFAGVDSGKIETVPEELSLIKDMECEHETANVFGPLGNSVQCQFS